MYNNPAFAEKYDKTVGYIPDTGIFALFLGLINQKAEILDVGCGPGLYAAELAKIGHNVTILDASSPMLKIASNRLQKITGNTPNKIDCDILDSTSRDNFMQPNTYDAIWCSGLFIHIPKEEQSEILKWFYTILRPDGCLFVNIIIDNPRLFASDGRFFGHTAEPRNFEVILNKCKFQTEYAIQTKIKPTEYNESFSETVWMNYFAKKIYHNNQYNTMNIDYNIASKLTSIAYSRSTKDYIKSHGVRYSKDSNKQSLATLNDSRIKIIESYLGKLDEFLGDSVKTPYVLDAGCGPGDYVAQMANRGWKSIGIDLSENSIQSARNNYYPKFNNQVTFSICDMCKLPDEWTDNFDAIICVTAFQHIPIDGGYAESVLGEFFRTLKPNGVLRIDVQLDRETGYDPDLRFIQGYNHRSKITSLVEQAGFTILDTNKWTLKSGKNTFQRPVAFNFLELWCRKKKV